MSDDDFTVLAVIGCVGFFVLLLVGWGVYAYTRPPAQDDRVGTAIRTSIEEALKGQPLTVKSITSVTKFTGYVKQYSAGVEVLESGSYGPPVNSSHYIVGLSRLCDEEKPECWRVDRVFDIRKSGDKYVDVVFYDKDPEPPQPPTPEPPASPPIETGSIGSPSPAGVGG